MHMTIRSILVILLDILVFMFVSFTKQRIELQKSIKVFYFSFVSAGVEVSSP